MFEQSPILRWRKYDEKYLLQGNKCSHCEKLFYPKKYLCSCGSQEFTSINFCGKGTVETFTKITTPSKIFSKQPPYCIGIIKLKEGPKILAQIADIEFKNLKIGLAVQVSFRKIYSAGESKIINYGLKFIPTE